MSIFPYQFASPLPTTSLSHLISSFIKHAACMHNNFFLPYLTQKRINIVYLKFNSYFIVHYHFRFLATANLYVFYSFLIMEKKRKNKPKRNWDKMKTSKSYRYCPYVSLCFFFFLSTLCFNFFFSFCCFQRAWKYAHVHKLSYTNEMKEKSTRTKEIHITNG